MNISHSIEERPREANERSRIGDWEADTVIGQAGKACFVTLADRKTRFLLCRKAERKTADCVTDAVIACLRSMPLHSITSDRGKEFSNHAAVTAALGVEFYFALPHHPWQRGTNENTNQRPAAGVFPQISGFFRSVGRLHSSPSRQTEPSPSQMPWLSFSL